MLIIADINKLIVCPKHDLKFCLAVEGTDITNFSWERGPFERCAECGDVAVGLLSAGGHHLTKRCKNCRQTVEVSLPELSKKTIYLDQFMFSSIYNVKNEGRLSKGHEAFAKEAYRLLRRCVLLQQITLPHSDIHNSETIVYHSPMNLRSLYESFGGDVSLRDHRDVEDAQMIAIAQAYFDEKEPNIAFDFDEITDDPWNDWLSDMHVGVRVDYGQFAENIRNARDETYQHLEHLASTWAQNKPSFEHVLNHEFESYGKLKFDNLKRWLNRSTNPNHSNPLNDHESALDPISREYSALTKLLEMRGIEESEHFQRIIKFWQWKGLREMPTNRISTYIWASVAQRIATGERKIIDKGLVNDIKMISTYAPYVDAMFIDKRSASILAEPRLSSDLEYKARIFSMSDTDSFLEYLREIESETPSDVQYFASRIYGID